MTILGLAAFPSWGQACTEGPCPGSLGAALAGSIFYSPWFLAPAHSAEGLCHAPPPLSVANWVSLPGTHPWRASCAWSVISETQPPIDNFPPINCALFLSFNLRHAINCDLLHLGTCLCLSWRKHSRSCGEKLDSQNGMVPGSRTIRNARS